MRRPIVSLPHPRLGYIASTYLEYPMFLLSIFHPIEQDTSVKSKLFSRGEIIEMFTLSFLVNGHTPISNLMANLDSGGIVTLETPTLLVRFERANYIYDIPAR
jgi:hypothetical protein